MNSPDCKMCGSRGIETILECPEMVLGTREYFDYGLCRVCGSLSLLEIPDNIDDYNNKYPNLDNKVSELNVFYKWVYRNLLFKSDLFSELVADFDNSYSRLKIKALKGCAVKYNSKILDIGCGNGEFLYNLKDLGFNQLTGIDPYLRDVNSHISSELVIKKGDVFDIQGTYDFITLHHTFEHMANPSDILEKIFSLLEPTGIALIRIPNIESISFHLYEAHWEGIHPPFHFHLPSSKGMEILFQRANLELIKNTWEHPYVLTFYSLNRKMGISDFDDQGARKFFSEKKVWKKIPPLFTKHEVNEVKRKSKAIAKTRYADYINYYLRRV